MPSRIAITGFFLTIWPVSVLAASCPGGTPCCDPLAVTHRDRAVDLYKSGQLAAATVEIREAIRVCPEHFFYHFMLGNALYRANRLQEARDSYQRAAELQPSDFETRISLGFTLFDLGDVAAANRHWVSAIRLAPESPLARAAAAVGLYSGGDRDNALMQFRKAGSLDARYWDPQALSIDIRWKLPARNVLSKLKELDAQLEE